MILGTATCDELVILLCWAKGTVCKEVHHEEYCDNNSLAQQLDARFRIRVRITLKDGWAVRRAYGLTMPLGEGAKVIFSGGNTSCLNVTLLANLLVCSVVPGRWTLWIPPWVHHVDGICTVFDHIIEPQYANHCERLAIVSSRLETLVHTVCKCTHRSRSSSISLNIIVHLFCLDLGLSSNVLPEMDNAKRWTNHMVPGDLTEPCCASGL